MPQISLHSPLGDLTVSEYDGAIVALDWGWASLQEPSDVLARAVQQLNAYFDDATTPFDLPLNPAGTDFQKRLWAALRAIPPGEVVTYGDLAASVGSHARAIGLACARNPIPIIIPCHRVVARTGALTGYSGGDGIATKAALLRLEGWTPATPDLFANTG